jgi:hypothetical protein
MKHKASNQAEFKKQGLYGPLYQQLNLQGPGFDDGPSMAPKGASMAQQARAAGYQDIYRDIQAMRDAEYKKEIKDGEIQSEFSGLGDHHMARNQRQLRNQGMYKHLMPRVKPVKHPYLPRTVTDAHRKSGLGAWLGQAAEKTGPGLTLALGALIVYLVFFRKKKDEVDIVAESEEPEVDEEIFAEEEIPSSRFYF